MTLHDSPKQLGDVRPLTKEEVRIYLWLVHETMSVAQMLAAQLRAIQIIACNRHHGKATADEVIALRLRGYTFEQIGDILDMDAEEARQLAGWNFDKLYGEKT